MSNTNGKATLVKRKQKSLSTPCVVRHCPLGMNIRGGVPMISLKQAGPKKLPYVVRHCPLGMNI